MTRKVWMLWYGGSSYRVFDTSRREDCEEFSSLAAAKEEFRRRPGDPYYPCVWTVTVDEGGPEAWIVYADPFQNGDVYPDLILSFGRRGGLQVRVT